jgi:hypothetical protein
MRVAYCTAGTIGAGHLMRGLAIARGLGRAGFRGEYRSFGPPLPFPAVAAAGYHALPMKFSALMHPALVMRTPLGRALKAYAPDLLIVDLFWAPLAPLLDELGCEAWLLLRSCPAGWLRGAPEAPFRRRRFRRVIAIEPIPHPRVRERIDPIVVANPDECRPAGALRERLRLPRRRRLVAVAQAGAPGEYEKLLELAGAGAIGFALTDPKAPFPAAEWLPGADEVVSGAGYNAFWEARWLGYAGRARFVPFTRDIDDQAWRARACARVRPRRNGADVLARWMIRGG